MRNPVSASGGLTLAGSTRLTIVTTLTTWNYYGDPPFTSFFLLSSLPFCALFGLLVCNRSLARSPHAVRLAPSLTGAIGHMMSAPPPQPVYSGLARITAASTAHPSHPWLVVNLAWTGRFPYPTIQEYLIPRQCVSVEVIKDTHFQVYVHNTRSEYAMLENAPVGTDVILFGIFCSYMGLFLQGNASLGWPDMKHKRSMIQRLDLRSKTKGWVEF